MITLQEFTGLATWAAESHVPDEKRGGCTCGFCVWSVDHVLIMSIRDAWYQGGLLVDQDMQDLGFTKLGIIDG